jgi:cobalamin biosynthesis protein CbiD
MRKSGLAFTLECRAVVVLSWLSGMTALAGITGCLPILGPSGIDCGPVPEPQCSKQVESLVQMAHANEPKKTIWAVRLHGDDGVEVIFTDGSGFSIVS